MVIGTSSPVRGHVGCSSPREEVTTGHSPDRVDLSDAAEQDHAGSSHMTALLAMHKHSSARPVNPALPTTAGRGINTVRAALGGESALSSAPAVAGIGGLAAVGGGLQAYKGIGELEHGHVVDGVADTGGGAANVAGGLAVAADFGPAAPIAFGVGSLLDGTRNIIDGVKGGDNTEVGIGAAKDLGGALLVAGGAASLTGAGAVVGVPLIVAGGIITAGASIFQNRAAIGHAVGHAASWTEHTVSTGISDVGKGLKDAGHFVSSLL